MARRSRERAKAEIETGSFSDISFLLIIFFVLTTTFVKSTGRPVDIPAASKPEEQKQSEMKSPTIALTADGLQYSLGAEAGAGRELSLAELKRELAALALPAKKESERIVIVNCADEVTYERYFQVVTAVAQAGGVIALLEEE